MANQQPPTSGQRLPRIGEIPIPKCNGECYQSRKHSGRKFNRDYRCKLHGPVNCHVCEMKFDPDKRMSTGGYRKLFLIMNRWDPNARRECPFIGCELRFNDLKSLRAHLLIHTAKVICINCKNALINNGVIVTKWRPWRLREFFPGNKITAIPTQRDFRGIAAVANNNGNRNGINIANGGNIVANGNDDQNNGNGIQDGDIDDHDMADGGNIVDVEIENDDGIGENHHGLANGDVGIGNDDGIGENENGMANGGNGVEVGNGNDQIAIGNNDGIGENQDGGNGNRLVNNSIPLPFYGFF